MDDLVRANTECCVLLRPLGIKPLVLNRIEATTKIKWDQSREVGFPPAIGWSLLARFPVLIQSTGEILKFEANLAKVLLGFVILECSDDFLQQKTVVDNGLRTIGRYRPNHGHVR